MSKPEIVGRGYHFIWHNDEMCLVIKKAPPGQEEKGLEVSKIKLHDYEGIEELAEEDINWHQLWREAVANDDTEDSYIDWRDDNYTQIVSDSSADYDPSWTMADYDLYSWLRDNWGEEIYYQAQTEEIQHTTIENFEELKNIIEEDGIVIDDCNDELLLEINLYFNNTTYRYVP